MPVGLAQTLRPAPSSRSWTVERTTQSWRAVVDTYINLVSSDSTPHAKRDAPAPAPAADSPMAVQPAITIDSSDIPLNITTEYLMETRDHSAIIALISVGVLTFIVVLTRCISRLFVVKSFGLDDGLAFFSVVRASFSADPVCQYRIFRNARSMNCA